MKAKARVRKLVRRQMSYDKMMSEGAHDDGPRKRMQTGGYKRPGSNKQ